MGNKDTANNNRRLGAHYEQLAADHLRQKGYRIISCNERTRYGEIDVIAQDKDTLVICEVKYRRHDIIDALEAVDPRKQRQVMRMAGHYLMKHHISEEVPVRFDVIAISGEVRLQHIENAFDDGI